MQDEILKSGRDTLLIAVPFVICLLGTIFRLDGLFLKAGNKPWIPYGLPRCAWNSVLKPVLTDPDGRVVKDRLIRAR